MEVKGPPSFLSRIMRRFAIKRPLTSELQSLKDKPTEANSLLEAQTVDGCAIGHPAKTFDRPPSFEFVIGDRGNSETAGVIYSDIEAPPSYTDVARRDASKIVSVDQNLPEVKFEEASSTLLDFEEREREREERRVQTIALNKREYENV
ncbi:hypothetical protein OSB04_027773 [Centaurea solstitialis]|uniref:Uncharacterized protein n=1 Tax=Centaurea solstitialis TaxID=347529 RepID=A0AA38VX12_9ASTR|nr:hypothetical protein OSB04_027773 [Centaurea solstitialis]